MKLQSDDKGSSVVQAFRDDHAEIPHYASADSAPLGFAVQRSAWVLPLFLLSFASLSAAMLISFDHLSAAYLSSLSQVGQVAVQPQEEISLGLRPFFGALFFTFGAFAAGTLGQRIKFTIYLCLAYLASILAVDIFLLWMRELGGPGPFTTIGDIIAGYAGLSSTTIVFFWSTRLPSGVRVKTRLPHSWRYAAILGMIIAANVGLVIAILFYASDEVEFLRNGALLGGLGPGIPLFVPTFTVLLAIAGALRSTLYRKSRKKIRRYSVAFLVPAFNEANNIKDCIHSLDEASLNYYPGLSKLYLVDNASTDGTAELARAELASCKSLRGDVLVCPRKGKSVALNFGLSRISEDIVVRVDADTIVHPSLLQKVIPYFSDPTVGGISGMPLPRDPSPLLSRMRAIEAHYNIGVLRLGQGAIDTIMCLPGIMSAYRRHALTELGGFAEGVNGEDTDITVRIGRLGYRVMVDPSIHVFSEVPRNLAHLREQRLRWARGSLHTLLRNKSIIWMRQGTRGVWTVPYVFSTLLRRAIIWPLLTYIGVVAVLYPSAAFLEGAAVAAVILGPHFLIILGMLLAYRRFDLVRFIPAYLALRLMRAYFMLEMLFTVPLKAAPASQLKEPDLAPILQEFPQTQRLGPSLWWPSLWIPKK